MLRSAKEINATQHDTGKDLWELVRNPLGSKGLYLKVTSLGTKTIYYRYNLPTGTKRHLICRWGEMELPDIFVEHTKLVKEVREGGDPHTERRRARQQRAAKPNRPKSYNQILDAWLNDYAKENLKGSTYMNLENRINKWVRPQLGKIAGTDLEPMHFKGLRDKAHKAGKTATANQLIQLCKGVNGWAVDELLLKTNPAADIRKVGKRVIRDIVWTDDEYHRIWQAVSGELDMATKLSPGQSLAMRVILLTGMRRAEGALLKRGELTLNELENSAEIVLSPERTKIHREHRVWCSPLTTSLIQEALEISKHPHQVFTNQSPKIGVQPGHLSKLFTDILKELGIAGTIHDCRHHVMTTCIKAGCCPTATDMLLGHVGMVGAGAVYNHSGNLPQMQSAWQFYSDWVARVCELDDGDSGKTNVIQLKSLDV